MLTLSQDKGNWIVKRLKEGKILWRLETKSYEEAKKVIDDYTHHCDNIDSCIKYEPFVGQLDEMMQHLEEIRKSDEDLFIEVLRLISRNFNDINSYLKSINQQKI